MSFPKKRMGRPEKDTEDKRLFIKAARLTQDELNRFINSTAKLRVSDSAFIRAAIKLTMDGIEEGEIDVVEFLELADN